jgi:hypothetical protein
MNAELVSYVEAGLGGFTAREMVDSIRDIKADIVAMQKRLDEK